MSLGIWVLLFFAGAVGQFVDSCVGMGFGVLSSSFLIAAGMSPAVVVATVNVAKIGNGLLAAASHASVGNVRWRWVLPLALPGVVGSVVGATLLVKLLDGVSRIAIPGLLLVMGLALLIRFWRGNTAPAAEPEPTETAPTNDRGWLPIAAIGFAGGAINAMTGAYGPFTTSSLLLLKGGHPRHAIGTVNMVEFMVAGSAAVTLLLQLDNVHLSWQLPVGLLLGGMLTSLPAAYLSRKLPARWLGVIVGVGLIALNVWALSRSLA